MPNYHYLCADCEAGLPDGADLLGAVFETLHRMEPTAAELAAASRCPRCGSANTAKTCLGTSITGYVRGAGYLDKAGVHRDMNLHKLVTDDPYADMRVTGEVDDLATRLRRGGQHNPKPTYSVSRPQPTE